MQRSHAYLLAASLLALAGCRDETSPLSPRSDDPAAQAQAQADGPGGIDTSFPTLTPPLVFLEPLGGSARSLPGVFDPDLSPVVELCPAEGACDAPLARWTNEGAEGVRVAGNHYHLNWHTGRTPVRAGETYRLRVRLGENEAGSLRVAVVASGGERRGVTGADVAVKAGQTVPVKFWIQKVRRLTVRLFPGATGSPASMDTLVGYGERVPYAYAAAEGYARAAVSVNAEVVAAQGEVVMDMDRVLLAGADRDAVLPPGGEELAASARAVLTAGDPAAAFQAHLDRVAREYEALGWREAQARVAAVHQAALDPVADSAALRRVDEALRNRTFAITLSPAAVAAARGPAAPRTSVAATGRNTVYFFVNGVMTTFAGGTEALNSVEQAIRDAGVPVGNGVEVRLFYNASILEPNRLLDQEVGECFKGLFANWNLISFLTFGSRLTDCLRKLTQPWHTWDGPETLRQIAQLRGLDHSPPPQDALALADTLRRRLRQNHNVIFVPHSQGNLMVQQGLKETTLRPDLIPGRVCAAAVSIASPMSHNVWWGLDESRQVTGAIHKHDFVLYFGSNYWPQIESAKTREWDGQILFMDIFFGWHTLTRVIMRARAGIDMHGLTERYLVDPEPRAVILGGLREKRDVLASLPGCEAQVQTGEVSGRVTHAQTGAGIAGARVGWSGGSVTTASDGRFTARVPAGRSDLVVSANGFVTTTMYGVNVSATVPLTLETVRLVPFSTSPGTISGAVRDARNANGISGATVEVRAGMNATAGVPVATVTSGAGGAYRVPNLPAGTYSVRAVAGGFAAGVATGIAVGTAEVNNQDVVLAPLTDDITVVLTWGATPRDLDSHLTGPLQAGGRFHVFYADGGSLTASPWASLDVDNTGGYGPETITIRRMFQGVYRYSVHDYSNRTSLSSTGMANSGARVRVFRGGTLLREVYVQPGRVGTLWTVFELEVNATGGVALRLVDAMTNQANDNAVTSRAAVPGGPGNDARVIEQAVAGAAKP